MKNVPKQIDVIVEGNPNILIGDRLTMKIPEEGISSDYFDVISVAHTFDTRAYRTSVQMVDSRDIRQLLETSPLSSISVLKRNLNALTRD